MQAARLFDRTAKPLRGATFQACAAKVRLLLSDLPIHTCCAKPRGCNSFHRCAGSMAVRPYSQATSRSGLSGLGCQGEADLSRRADQHLPSLLHPPALPVAVPRVCHLQHGCNFCIKPCRKHNLLAALFAVWAVPSCSCIYWLQAHCSEPVTKQAAARVAQGFIALPIVWLQVQREIRAPLKLHRHSHRSLWRLQGAPRVPGALRCAGAEGA